MSDRNGKLLYILSANLPGNLLQLYRADSASPKIAALGLVRDDGYLISRYPEPDVASMDEIYGQPAADAMTDYLHANHHPQRGQVEMPGGDGKARELRVMQRLQHFPVTLFIEVPMPEIKAAWWGDRHEPYFMMALLLASMAALYGLSHRHRRAWSEAERRAALRRRYEQALNERSQNEIFMIDADTLQFSYANDCALEKLGYTLAQLQQINLLALHPRLGVETLGAMIEPLRRGERESVKYQTIQACANGSTYPVEVSLQLMKTEEGGEGFMAIVNDITALRQAAENLRAYSAPAERRDFTQK